MWRHIFRQQTDRLPDHPGVGTVLVLEQPELGEHVLHQALGTSNLHLVGDCDIPHVSTFLLAIILKELELRVAEAVLGILTLLNLWWGVKEIPQGKMVIA